MTVIMIVDDGPQNLYMLETILKSAKYDVVKAENGADAFEMAKASPPDMVISDILMPIMDGFRFCHEWRANEKLKEKPFIFYTATYIDSKDEQFALNLGADRFLVKPVKPEMILKTVAEVFEEYKNGKKTEDTIEITTSDVLQEYNEILFHKLEKKVMQLEHEMAERKVMEQALRISEDQFRKAFENGAVGIALYDKEIRYLRINDEFCNMLGYKPEEIKSKKVTDITHPDDIPRDLENIKKLENGEIPVYSVRKRYIRKDGSVLWAYIRLSTINDEEGRLLYYLVFANDITEQMEMRERERQALGQIEKNLVQLATLNDQIKNPLSIIIGVLAMEKKTKSNEQIREAVMAIDDIIDKLDMGWAESAKVREFMMRYDQITKGDHL